MAKYIIEIPEGWKSGGEYCPMNCNGNCAATKCPLANAKEAVEIKDNLCGIREKEGEEIKWRSLGQPVVLYAVKAEGEE